MRRSHALRRARPRDRGSSLARLRLPASRASLGVLASLALLACTQQEVSLGDDRALRVDAAVLPPPSRIDAGRDSGPPPERPGDSERDAGRVDWHGDCGRCPAGEICSRPDDPSCGAPSAPARCAPIALVCPAADAPVCGCDGQSYASRCEAAALGVTVRASGPCEQQSDAGVPCSGFFGGNGAGSGGCGFGHYCRYPLGAFCGASGTLGVCEPRPERCEGFGQPVCACDGRTYEDACLAARAGVSVAFLGECGRGGGGPGDPFRGVAACAADGGVGCAQGEYCMTPGCGAQLGECRARPVACAEGAPPACGCDGTRYANACEAARAGVSVDPLGSCAP